MIPALSPIQSNTERNALILGMPGSAGEIAAALGISRNTVCGVRNRAKDGYPEQERRHRARRQLIATVRSLAAEGLNREMIATKTGESLRVIRHIVESLGIDIVMVEPSVSRCGFVNPFHVVEYTDPSPLAFSALPERDTVCHFPIGDPKTPGFRFCGEPRVRKNYCAACASIAFAGGPA